jgi:ribonuclease M5
MQRLPATYYWQALLYYKDIILGGSGTMRIKEYIVVEGRSDTVAIQRAVDAVTIETRGSAIGAEVIEKIKLAQEKRGVIIFTDPDYAGERIRKIIQQKVPGCKHAFLPKEEAAGRKGKVGVEHASPEAIRQALEGIRTEGPPAKTLIEWSDLFEADLVGGPNAKQRRTEIGKILRIGYANSKQLYKRLNAFEISRQEFLAAVEQVDEMLKEGANRV